MLTNVYIAAPIQHKSAARELAAYIEDHCPKLHVCSVWHDLPDTDTMPRGDSKQGLRDGHLRRMAIMDLAQLSQASTFVYLAYEKSGGAGAEFGYALAHNIPSIVVGKFLGIFQCLPEVKFTEVDAGEILEAAKGEMDAHNHLLDQLSGEDE